MENQNESCGKQNESCGNFLHPKRKLWKVESCGKSLKIPKIAKNESCGKGGGVLTILEKTLKSMEHALKSIEKYRKGIEKH